MSSLYMVYRSTQNSNMNEVGGPGEMDFTSPQNLSGTWSRWKRGMEYYLTATCTDKTKAQKVAIFKPGFHISQFIGDLLSGIAEGENDFRNTKDFIHR